MQGLRAYGVAAAAAVNANDLALPALTATATARRVAQLPALFKDELGRYVPGPRPVAVLGVSALSENRKDIVACSLEDGWVLDGPGGTPLEPARAGSGQFQMLLEGGVWKVDGSARSDVSCEGVQLPVPS